MASEFLRSRGRDRRVLKCKPLRKTLTMKEQLQVIRPILSGIALALAMGTAVGLTLDSCRRV